MVVGERENLEMPSRGCWDVVVTGSRGGCRSEETLAEGPARKHERVVVGRKPVDKVGQGGGIGGSGGEKVEAKVKLLLCYTW